jgi:hypothetical protein
MMRDLFREAHDLNSRIRLTVKHSGRTLVARVKARLSAMRRPYRPRLPPFKFPA